MANPLIPQGTLNRLRASVLWNDTPELNVTSSFLGREGIRLAFEGEATTFINTMTGAVTSPEPYQAVSLTINLLKTQPLANSYKNRYELNTLLGDGIVRPDVNSNSAGLSPYQLSNCGIENVRELNFAGEDAGWVVTIKGFYQINSSLFT